MSTNGKSTAMALNEPDLDTSSQKARNVRHDHNKPYSIEVHIEGKAPCLMHRYDPNEVEAKGQAKKGSQQKKTDNPESMVYRDQKTKEIGWPAENIKSCLAEAAKSFQDPRSPRKNAHDILRASIIISPDIASLGKATWDFLDKRGAVIKMSRVTRIRPGFEKGWKLKFFIHVLQPQYIAPDFMEQIAQGAGAFVGLSDMRPDFGRFAIRKWEIRPFALVE